jgi:hypothetical protein
MVGSPFKSSGINFWRILEGQFSKRDYYLVQGRTDYYYFFWQYKVPNTQKKNFLFQKVSSAFRGSSLKAKKMFKKKGLLA